MINPKYQILSSINLYLLQEILFLAIAGEKLPLQASICIGEQGRP